MTAKPNDMPAGPAQSFAIHGPPISPRRAIRVSILCWIGFAVIAWLVTSGRSAMFDDLGVMFWRTGPELHPRGPAAMLESVRDITALGGTLLLTCFSIAAVVALLFLRHRREAVLFAATALAGTLVNSSLKLLIGRARPDIVPHLTEAGGNSFPSGHSFNSAMIYIGMALAFATFSARQSVRFTVVGCALFVSMIVAWSRVWLGVHFPSDVAAGWLGGAGWAFMAAAIFQRPAEIAARSPVAEKLDPAG